jgi:hypothetical protein
MKKLLVIAMLSAFAVSSFAADPVTGSALTLKGDFEFRGLMHDISPEADTDDSYNSTAAFYHYTAQLHGKLAINPQTNFNFRLRFADDYVGTTQYGKNVNGTQSPNWGSTDRYWIDYTFGDTKLSLGRMARGYASGVAPYMFATGFYDNMANGKETSSIHDTIRVDYKLSEANSLFLATAKLTDTNFGGVQDPNAAFPAEDDIKDVDLYVAGFKMNPEAGAFAVNPTVSFLNGNEAYGSQLAAHVNFQMMPANGLQLHGALAMNKQMSEIGRFYNGAQEDSYEKPMVFGGYVDAGWATDSWKAGLFLAYGSADSNEDTGRGASFAFGDDWVRTMIVDDGLWLAGSGFSPAGMTQIGLYGDIKVGNKLTISPVFSYWMSNADTGFAVYNSNPLHEDAGIMELDLTAKYELIEGTTYVKAGLAYAAFTDLGDYDANTGLFAVDNNGKVVTEDTGYTQMTAFWMLNTNF